jgi:hypothetical protein
MLCTHHDVKHNVQFDARLEIIKEARILRIPLITPVCYMMRAAGDSNPDSPDYKSGAVRLGRLPIQLAAHAG